MPCGSLPLRARSHGPFRDLLALDLRDEAARSDDELPDRRVLELFGRELETHADGLGLVEQHSDVVLIPREAVECVGEHHLALAIAHQAPNLSHSGPLER